MSATESQQQQSNENVFILRLFAVVHPIVVCILHRFFSLSTIVTRACRDESEINIVVPSIQHHPISTHHLPPHQPANDIHSMFDECINAH